jgi:hypothetical protein
MNVIDNLTPFGYDTSFACDLDGSTMVVLCVAGRFRMPPAGTPWHDPLELAEEQFPPPMGDEYWSDPATSSLRTASQGVAERPGAEVYVRGSAWAPGGLPVTKMRTSVRVGPCSKQVDVIGDRYWTGALVGVTPTSPEPFVSMPLQYERSYGGTVYGEDGRVLKQEARNPIGRGLYARQRDAVDLPLPNLEAPGMWRESWDDRGTPCSFGPIPGSWQPRLAWAGTYDQYWVDERLPLWPDDTDPRFFCSAAPGLSTDRPLRGGEVVLIEGMSPRGDFAFHLPDYRIVAKSVYPGQSIRSLLRLEAVLLEPDEGAVTLFWRHLVPLGHGHHRHLHSIVRLLESWEDFPE